MPTEKITLAEIIGRPADRKMERDSTAHRSGSADRAISLGSRSIWEITGQLAGCFLLEKKGFMRRKSSEDDARVVQMSLTDKSYKHIANRASQQEALNEFIFAEFSDNELEEFIGRLATLKNQLQKACLKVAMDI